MGQLASGDYEAVLDIVVEIARNGSADSPLPLPALEDIRRLIPAADTVAGWLGQPKAHRHASAVAGAYLPWTPAEDRLLDRLGFDDPLLPAPAFFGRARRLSDAIAPEAYRATDFYRHLGRHHGLEYSIATWHRLPDGGIRGLWLDASGRDFDDRDVAVLELLGRQLERLARPKGRPISAGYPPRSIGLTDRQAEILALAALGRSNDEIGHDLYLSPFTVRTHLEHAFDRLQVHTRAAAVARAWELGILPKTPRRPS